MRSASLLRGSLRRFSNDARLRELARTAPLRVDYLNIPTTPQYQRTAAIAKIASRQTLSYDKDAVRLDEKLRDAFERNMTFAASISGTERGKLSAESDPLTAAHRFVDRCNFFSASNEELIVAFGLPIESPNSPKALFVDFTVFALAMVCIELTLAALRSVSSPGLSAPPRRPYRPPIECLRLPRSTLQPRFLQRPFLLVCPTPAPAVTATP